MRSTRKSEGYAGLVAFAVFVGLIVLVGFVLPDPPTTPRWQGAGRETPQQGGTFVFHHESDVRSFDPHKAFDEISNMGIKLMFEGLLDYETATGDLVPRLVREIPEPSEDGATYRFQLRRGVRFQDSHVFENGRGREVTAEDVRWSLEHMIHPDTISPGATFYALVEGYEAFRNREAAHLEGVRVIDRYTFEITLAQPDQTFMYTMAMTFAVPVAHELYEYYEDDPSEIARNPVGTGPFRLESWEPGVEVTFVRNPTYYREGEPYVDRMVYTLNLTRGPAVMRFRNGDLDHIHRQTPADYLALREMDAWEPYRDIHAKTNLWGVIMNTQLAPFDNRHLRRAVAFALNRERWNRARANRLVITGQPIPRRLPGFDPDLPGQHEFDLDRAREEMQLAGHPDGLDEEVEVWVGEGETGRTYGELIQADLAEIGIPIRIRQVAFPIYLQETGQPGRVQMLLGGWSMDFPDPANFLDILFHTRSIHEEDSENKAFYSNPEVDRLLDEARIERNRERRMALYREASMLIVDDAPWAFMWSDLAMDMWQPYVRNFQVNPVWDNFYRDVWLDLPRQRWTGDYVGATSLPALMMPWGRPGVTR